MNAGIMGDSAFSESFGHLTFSQLVGSL
jgi:hypothetical protein